MSVSYLNVDEYNDFKNILLKREIKTVFQPIFSLSSGEVLGFEALSRGPENTSLENPSRLFDMALNYNMLWEIELLCRQKAFEKASDCGLDKLLFINVDPNIIKDPQFRKGFTKEFISSFNMNPQNLVFEITERNAIEDLKNFRKILEHYTNQGYKIAIDDTGSGYSGLLLLAETNPQYIKIDMELIRNIDKDFIKQSLLKTLKQFASSVNIKVIAEGIETEKELETLIELDIDYGQGFFLQRPSAGLLNILPEAKRILNRKNEEKKRFIYHSPVSLPVGEIAKREIAISPETCGCEVDSLFKENPFLHGIPIVDEGIPQGLITRNSFYSTLSSQYGVYIYNRRPIKIIQDKNPLVLDYFTPLEQVSHSSLARQESKLYDEIIITRENKYFGIVTIKDLLLKTTQMELNVARHSNPLTGLPGNIIIENKLNEALNSGESFNVIYVDLDNFKAYNDLYGFENGDKVLAYTSNLLAKVIAKIGNSSSFLGHIGGDDFIIISKENHAILCEEIINRFEEGKRKFYSETDWKKGFVCTENRSGIAECFPLVSISLAVVTCDQGSLDSVAQLGEKASKIKHLCKKTPGSCWKKN